MKAFTVTWNPEKDETNISFSPEFLASDWLVRADVIKDALGELNELYNKSLMENSNGK